jgi:hypothetical protein
VKKLENPIKFINDRMYAEMWLGSKTTLSDFKSLHNSNINHYEIEYKQNFICIINEISSSIVYNEEGLIVLNTTYKTPSQSNNIHYKSIITLESLQRNVKHLNPKNKNVNFLIEYFGLNLDGSLSNINSVSIYYRVDLIRLVILLQIIKENPNSYAIYADLDTRPLSKDIIFTEESINLLNTFGLVLPRGIKEIFENSFHILAGENVTCDEYMRISIEKILVEFNIQKILNDYKNDEQDIFSDYKAMFLFYFTIIYNQVLELHPQINSRYDSWVNGENPVLNQINLLNLDMIKVGNLYAQYLEGSISNYRRMLFNIRYSIKTFPLNYPIRDDLQEISPSEGVYLR